MTLVQLRQIQPVEIFPGFRARMVHTKQMSIIYLDIRSGSVFPEHHHPHEQVSSLVSGSFELTVNGKTIVMQPGTVIVIAPDEPHSGRALADCRIIDTFHPVREDYRALMK
ncbi:MAG TPA: cupin domain-containing protein [Chitinophagaceae bacterium]|nr:cupin domain-containing protein [Chitinophagaceae bacterium]